MTTNEELIRAAKQGDVAAYEMLFKRNDRLCYEVAHRYSNVADIEELAAISRYGMLKAYNSYDVDKGIKFATYAITCMTNEIFMAHRRERKHCDVGSIDEVIYTTDGDQEVTLLDKLESDENVSNEVCDAAVLEIVRDCIDSLKDREKEIIKKRYLDCKTQLEVSEEMGYSQSYICRLERKALNNLRSHLNNKGVYDAEQTFN